MTRLGLVLSCLAALPAAAFAQHPAFSVGPSFQGTDGLNTLGVHVAAALGTARRAGVTQRLDVSYTTHTPPQVVAVGAPCPPPPEPCAFQGYSPSSLSVYGATFSAVYFDPKETRLWGYWIAGLGVYGVTQGDDGAYLRAGLNVGFGWRISDGAFVEARYHGIIHPARFRGFLPITFGLRF